MRESMLLKVVAIIMIIGGAFGLLVGLMGLLGGTFLSVGSLGAGGLVIILSLLSLVFAALELVAGIIGVKNWNKPENAQSCMTFGIIILVIAVLNNGASIFIGKFSGVNIVSALIGLVLPILYVYGASQLKKAQ